MLWWIEGSQIVGVAIADINKPDNWLEVEGVEAGDRNDVYYNGTGVLLKPPQPSPNHTWDSDRNEWVDSAIPPTPEPEAQPDWDGAVMEFQYPGNPLYGAVWGKVKAAGEDAKDHWDNFKALMVSPNLRSLPALAASINHMATLLSDAGQELTDEDKQLWNELMEKHGFPVDTHLG